MNENFEVTIVVRIEAESRDVAAVWARLLVARYGEAQVEVVELDTPEARRKRMCLVGREA
jgi:hypothetical protein